MINKIFLDKEIINDILKKGGITFLFRIIAMAFSFITIACITNFFGQKCFGNYSIALTILQMVVMIFALGVPNAFISFSGGFDNHSKTKGLLMKASKIVLFFSIIPMFIFYFGAYHLPILFFNKPNLSPFFIIISFGIPFLILHELLSYYFISLNKYLIYSFFYFIMPNVIFTVLIIIIYLFKFPEYLIFLAYTSSYAVTVLLQILTINFDKIKPIRIAISNKDIIKKSFPMMVSGIFLILLNWTDILILGRLETEGNIGIYNTAFKVGYLALFFVVSMNVVIMNKISILYHSNKMGEMKKVINRATQIVIILTLPLAIIIIIFSKNILNLFGQGIDSGSTTLILITLGALFNAMTGNVDQILNMTNNQKIVRNVFFSGFVLNVILNFYLIPKYGIDGAALSSLITNIIVNVIFVIVIKRKLGFYTFI